MHVSASLADCGCVPDMPCPCPIFIPMENVVAHPDDMQLKKGRDCPPPFFPLKCILAGHLKRKSCNIFSLKGTDAGAAFKFMFP